MILYFQKDTIYPHSWKAYDQLNKEHPQVIAVIRPTADHTFIKTTGLVDFEIMKGVMQGAESIRENNSVAQKGKFELVVASKDNPPVHPKERAANQEASDLTNFEHKG